MRSRWVDCPQSKLGNNVINRTAKLALPIRFGFKPLLTTCFESWLVSAPQHLPAAEQSLCNRLTWLQIDLDLCEIIKKPTRIKTPEFFEAEF